MEKKSHEDVDEEAKETVGESSVDTAIEDPQCQEPQSTQNPKSYEQSLDFKKLGNAKFGEGDFAAAEEAYTAAIDACPEGSEHAKHKSVLLSNRAATFLKLQIKENYETAVTDCTAAIELDKENSKAFLRRAQLYELLENLEDALTDYQTLFERSPTMPGVRDACARLPQQIEEKNEKMKTEMMDKLKDLGNLVLKPFGLSTDNFKMEPQATGGYSVKFEPSKKK